jgi:hypothetical protein
MVQYTIEQCVFLYESYVKCGSAIKRQRKFHHKFPGITVPSTTGIHKLNKKVRSTGSLLDKKPAKKKWCVLTKEKLDDIRARLEYTPQKSLRHLPQETSILKLSAAKMTKRWISTYLNGIESACMYRDIFSISYNIGKFILLSLWSNTRESLVVLGGEPCSSCLEQTVACNYASEHTVDNI